MRRLLALCAFAAASGCGTLPTIVPDMDAKDSRPVRLEGARGPLSAQQSREILARLASRGAPTSIFERQSTATLID